MSQLTNTIIFVCAILNQDDLFDSPSKNVKLLLVSKGFQFGPNNLECMYLWKP